MLLDTTPFTMTADEFVPEKLNFKVEFEPTKVEYKKYVINGDTGEYIGVVETALTVLVTVTSLRVFTTVTEHLGSRV